MHWLIQDDGTFSLLDGPVSLQSAYPAIDGGSVRPVRVEVTRTAEGGVIRYTLAEGYLDVALGCDGQGMTVAARLGGRASAPWRVAPLGDGILDGAARCIHQGQGWGGPSGTLDLPASAKVESYGLTGLLAEDGTALVLAAHDFRRFVQMTVLVTGDPGVTRATAWFRTEKIPLECELALPLLYLRAAPNAWSGMQAAARDIARAMSARTRQPISYHWCSWYYLCQHITARVLDEYLTGFTALTPPLPLQSIQIDVGYYPSSGDWLETTAPWPGGLHAAFARIAVAGYRPGIWIAPFMVGNRSRLFQEHPEWILRAHDGNPYDVWRIYNEPKLWGYPDEEFYTLDTSHPEAFAWLRTVFRTLRGWGATLYKTDFMYRGLTDSILVRRHTPGKTSAEYLRDVLAMIREEIGEESFWLGCIAPFHPFIGYADAMRIGGDVGASWAGDISPQNMLRESEADQYFNNIWWQNDPDAILVRDRHVHLTPTEVRSLALWQGILGGVVCTSDPLHQVAPDRLALWRFLEPGEPGTAALPYYATREPLRVAVRRFHDPDAWAVLIFNATEMQLTRSYPLAELTGETSLHAFHWGPEGAEPAGQVESLLLTLPPHDATLYYLTATPTPPPPGLTLGGAGRVTCLEREIGT